MKKKQSSDGKDERRTQPPARISLKTRKRRGVTDRSANKATHTGRHPPSPFVQLKSIKRCRFSLILSHSPRGVCSSDLSWKRSFFFWTYEDNPHNLVRWTELFVFWASSRGVWGFSFFFYRVWPGWTGLRPCKVFDKWNAGVRPWRSSTQIAQDSEPC